MNKTIAIRKAIEADQDQIWAIIQEAIAKGDTLAFAPDANKDEMLGFWCAPYAQTYVAEFKGNLLGTFFIKDNQPSLGAHVANAGYITSSAAVGKGVGSAMCEFSLGEAKRLGYYAMQFNLVVKSNERAVKLWQRMGFDIIGEIPDAFNHSSTGLTNAYIMWRRL